MYIYIIINTLLIIHHHRSRTHSCYVNDANPYIIYIYIYASDRVDFIILYSSLSLCVCLPLILWLFCLDGELFSQLFLLLLFCLHGDDDNVVSVPLIIQHKDCCQERGNRIPSLLQRKSRKSLCLHMQIFINDYLSIATMHMNDI